MDRLIITWLYFTDVQGFAASKIVLRVSLEISDEGFFFSVGRQDYFSNRPKLVCFTFECFFECSGIEYLFIGHLIRDLGYMRLIMFYLYGRD